MVHFANFWGRNFFSPQNRALSCTTSCVSSTIPKFRKNWWYSSKKTPGQMEGWKKGWTDPILQDLCSYHRGFQKQIQSNKENVLYKNKWNVDIFFANILLVSEFWPSLVVKIPKKYRRKTHRKLFCFTFLWIFPVYTKKKKYFVQTFSFILQGCI